MLAVFLLIAAAGAVYVLYLEINRARHFWKLISWLKTERRREWEATPGASRPLDIEGAVARLRRGRLAADAEFVDRHDAATRRGRHLAVALAVTGTAIVVALTGFTLFEWSL
jgi:Flp pilus assembly protein TadB